MAETRHRLIIAAGHLSRPEVRALLIALAGRGDQDVIRALITKGWL